MERLFLPLTVAVAFACWQPLASLAAEAQPAERQAADKPVVRLMAEKQERHLRNLLPRVEDEEVQKILDDPMLILYTDNEMPKAYQFLDGMLPGIHRVSYNISANGSEPFGNGNREFPWATPAGAHRSKSVSTFRFLRLPVDENGKVIPIVWFHSRSKLNGQMTYGWRYPVGTAVGEVLLMRGPDAQDYCFELRIRFREQGDWDVDAFRPFPRAEDLAERIKELRPAWGEDQNLISFIEQLKPAPKLPQMTLVDKHPRVSFRQTMAVHELPSLDDDALVRELMTQTTFKSAEGESWMTADGGEATAAPTTKAPFHVVPAHYEAGFVAVDRVSCMRCHETVNQPVDRFQGGRDWYGRIRGSDGIFSFHPFDPSCISGNGYGQGVAMRKEFTAAGVIAQYDPAKHDKLRYAQVPYLVE